MQEDEIEITTIWTPEQEDLKDRWIFPDSENLPEELTYAGQYEKLSSTNVKIPCHKFREKTGRCWYLSMWTKPITKLPIKSGDVCKVYLNKDKRIEVLRLN